MRRVVRVGLLLVLIVSAIGAVAGFYLPWLHVAIKPDVTGGTGQAMTFRDLAGALEGKMGRVVLTVHQVGQATEGQLADLGRVPPDVTGAQIPSLASHRHTKLLLALSSLRRESTPVPSALIEHGHLVYLVPLIASVCALLALWARGRPLVIAFVGGAAMGLAVFGWWHLSTWHTELLLASVTIGQGLWLSCAAYAALGIASLGLAALQVLD